MVHQYPFGRKRTRLPWWPTQHPLKVRYVLSILDQKLDIK